MSVVLWPSHVVQDLTASTQWDPTCARERSYVAVAIMPVLMEADVSVRLVVVTYEEHAIIFDIYKVEIVSTRCNACRQETLHNDRYFDHVHN